MIKHRIQLWSSGFYCVFFAGAYIFRDTLFIRTFVTQQHEYKIADTTSKTTKSEHLLLETVYKPQNNQFSSHIYYKKL